MTLLWSPESWSQRLAELEARSGDLKEAPLRRDVRSLGTLLGEVLREQAGEDLFAQVEALRQGTIRRRDAEAHGKTKRPRCMGRRRWNWCTRCPWSVPSSSRALSLSISNLSIWPRPITASAAASRCN